MNKDELEKAMLNCEPVYLMFMGHIERVYVTSGPHRLPSNPITHWSCHNYKTGSRVEWVDVSLFPASAFRKKVK